MRQEELARAQQVAIQRAWADAQPTLLLLANAFVRTGREANRLMDEAIEKHRMR